MEKTSLNKYLDTQASIHGWLYPEDVWLFQKVHAFQKRQGLSGDLLEIGVYHGKSAILMGYFARGRERLVVCDLFEQPAIGAGNRAENVFWYSDLNRRLFESNYLRFHNRLPHIVSCHSPYLIKVGNLFRTFRFIHVDGSHLYSVVKQDIRTAQCLLRRGGIVAFDDYRSEHTPGVSAAIWEAVVQGGLIPLCVTPQKLYGTWNVSNERFVSTLAVWARRSGRFDVFSERIRGRNLLRFKSRAQS